MLHKWRSHPKPPGYVDKKAIWKSRLSKIYLFFAAGTFLTVAYLAHSGKTDWVDYYGLRDEEDERYKTPSSFWLSKIRPQNAKVYRVSGTNIYDVTPKKPAESEAEE